MTTVYDQPLRPFVVGQIRVRRWNAIGTLHDEGMLETWTRRIAQYWHQQEQRFGVRFDMASVDALPDAPHVIESHARVAEILPGPRRALPELGSTARYDDVTRH